MIISTTSPIFPVNITVIHVMSSQFFSPEDVLNLESAKRSTVSAPSESIDEPAEKRQRLNYEGEPDTSKWAVQPAPDIFSNTDCTPNAITSDPEPPAPSDDAEAADEFASLQVPRHVLIQVQELCVAQHDFERRLWEHRQAIMRENDKGLQQMLAREMVHSVSDKEKEDVARQHRVALERADRRAIEKLDDLRYRQQMMLQNIGVPGFFPSSSVDVMERQQRILQHLLKLSP
ncbi:hypothetical protein FBU59_002454 [Linderina macrospora]|uniref:Uncharacterized protein n=1 Tax=Linderina macrospora TaxID=4868 RepID=A0ACC1JBF5_9FUNG|nr:hypothetical protein FBU59_002454 [Linderina macrospora]